MNRLHSLLHCLGTEPQNVGRDGHSAPVKGIQSSSMPSSGAIYLPGYCATYMGAVSVGLAETRRTADYQTTVFNCVNKLLERSSGSQTGDEIFADDKQGKVRTVFVDAMTSYLVVYDVDAAWRVTSSRRFELCRVAFCSAALHPSDRRLLAWLYHPPPTPPATNEPRRPAQLETHVVQLSTELRARRVAVRVGEAFQRLYAEVEAAQAVARLQAADERRSRATTVDEPETTIGRTASTIIAGDMVAIQYLQYANAAFDDEDEDDGDVHTTFETFRPVIQTTEV